MSGDTFEITYSSPPPRLFATQEYELFSNYVLDKSNDVSSAYENDNH